jgi:hypothetical protein
MFRCGRVLSLAARQFRPVHCTSHRAAVSEQLRRSECLPPTLARCRGDWASRAGPSTSAGFRLRCTRAAPSPPTSRSITLTPSVPRHPPPCASRTQPPLPAARHYPPTPFPRARRRHEHWWRWMPDISGGALTFGQPRQSLQHGCIVGATFPSRRHAQSARAVDLGTNLLVPRRRSGQGP